MTATLAWSMVARRTLAMNRLKKCTLNDNSVRASKKCSAQQRCRADRAEQTTQSRCCRIRRKSTGQAAHAGFDLLLSGHTHGGQICLPGSTPITLDSVLPRHMGSGPWKQRDMVGYTSVGVGTSVVAVRINCLPEITLHHLQCAA